MIKGVDNVFISHKPQLKELLEQLSYNRLKESDYPYVIGKPSRIA